MLMVIGIQMVHLFVMTVIQIQTLQESVSAVIVMAAIKNLVK
jgi:hypothetical protein